jgi:hypothetical protein
MMSEFNACLIGAIMGALGTALLIAAILDNNPTNTGKWVCTDWQIVNYQPECHVMSKQGDK